MKTNGKPVRLPRDFIEVHCIVCLVKCLCYLQERTDSGEKTTSHSATATPTIKHCGKTNQEKKCTSEIVATWKEVSHPTSYASAYM